MASASFIIGIIGNVISILMFLSPVKTFTRIVKKKSTENFKGIPYITTLLSASLWSFYGLLKLKRGGLLVLTVNGAGTILHIIYVSLFIFYAPKEVKIQSMKLVALIDVGFLGIVVAITLLAIHGSIRLTLVGLICTVLTIGMYAAPLSVMKTVIKMKSVKYMPFFLSFFQFLNGGVWTTYAVLVRDIYIGVPNGVGFILGSAQILLYVVYKYKPPSKSVEIGEEEEGSPYHVKSKLEMQGFAGKKVGGPKPTVDHHYAPDGV